MTIRPAGPDDFTAAPWYERLGFRRLSDTELTPGLRAIRTREAERGLDRWRRVMMIRTVAARSTAA